ncbi:MAG: hypothetical protein HYU69_00525 [Bacteroidetes bacterium]|nr:hypothetical protein [Bacteroidota bacterium]
MSEKRYIKLSLRKNAIGDSSNYLTLFDMIAAQIEYDEKAIKRDLVNYSLKKNFAVTKLYLYHLILRTLKNFHFETSTDMLLADKIQQANLLLDKELFDQCENITLKALSIANKHELKLKTIELLDIELRALQGQLQIKKIKEKAEKYYRMKQKLWEQQEQIFYLQKIAYNNFVQLKTEWVTELEQKTIFKSPSQIKEGDLLSIHAKILYHHVWSGYLFSVNKSEKTFKHLMKLDMLFDKNPHLIGDYCNLYISMLNNLNVVLLGRNDFKRVLLNIEKMKLLKMRSVEGRIRVRERLVSAEMSLHKHTGEFENSLPLVNEANKLLENKKLSEVYRMVFNLHLFIYYFAFEEYKTALRFLNHFLSGSRKNIRKDLHKTARLLYMITHYKLRNFDYLESFLKNAVRSFNSNEGMDKMERLFLSFFTNIILITKEDERRSHFLTFKLALEKLEKQKIMLATYFYNFNFSDWAEAEMTNRKYKEFVYEKFHPDALAKYTKQFKARIN